MTSKVLAIFDAFSADYPELTLTELARRAQISVPTAHRRVAELLEWGALERSNNGTLRIGLRLWEVATLAPRALSLREAALPYLEDLYELTHENVQLAVREGEEVLYVERIAGRRAVRVHTRVGGRFPLHATGVGVVLLAHAPEAVVEAVCSTPLERYTRHTVVDPRELRRRLAECRAVGFAVSNRQVSDDTLSIAAPVVAPDDSVVAAVSLVVHSDTNQPGALIVAVRAAARGIGRAMSL
ncbi:IclR family transcriptional regulator [Rhodococcus globerulus]|uniref:IclR family transcriptional regulator n=1 Tax=Rhodococcus globerulus TaxID=33008 RepID=UPI00286A72FB|nr:IclR family transcriptional regulator [Rhodococcus globerulus]